MLAEQQRLEETNFISAERERVRALIDAERPVGADAHEPERAIRGVASDCVPPRASSTVADSDDNERSDGSADVPAVNSVARQLSDQALADAVKRVRTNARIFVLNRD